MAYPRQPSIWREESPILDLQKSGIVGFLERLTNGEAFRIVSEIYYRMMELALDLQNEDAEERREGMNHGDVISKYTSLASLFISNFRWRYGGIYVYLSVMWKREGTYQTFFTVSRWSTSLSNRILFLEIQSFIMRFNTLLLLTALATSLTALPTHEPLSQRDPGAGMDSVYDLSYPLRSPPSSPLHS